MTLSLTTIQMNHSDIESLSSFTIDSSTCAMSFTDFVQDLTTHYEDDSRDVTIAKLTLEQALTFSEKLIFMIHLYVNDYSREAAYLKTDKRVLQSAIKRMNYKIRKTRDLLKKC